jgi:archaellum biogenesis ATPase FlaH
MGNIPDHVVQALLKNSVGGSDLNVSLDELESFGDESSIQGMFKSIAAYNQMLKERITFINKDLTKAIPFTRENLYLICAYSGSGKSTIAANVSYPLWKQGKKSLVISNEESEQDVLFRIACLELGYNFNDYKKGLMPMALQKDCAVLFPEIAKYVKVIDVNYKEGISTKVEGVKNILEVVKDKDYSCAMIDYYQLIKRSAGNPSASTYEVLNEFRIWLGQYIKRANIPIVVFAQLHSLGKRNNKDLDNRIKHCPDIYEPSTVVLEVIPDFDNKTSEFVIHKDRFGLAGHKIVCAFEKGRFVTMDNDAIRRLNQQKIDDIEEKAGVENDDDDQHEKMPDLQGRQEE